MDLQEFQTGNVMSDFFHDSRWFNYLPSAVEKVLDKSQQLDKVHQLASLLKAKRISKFEDHRWCWSIKSDCGSSVLMFYQHEKDLPSLVRLYTKQGFRSAGLASDLMDRFIAGIVAVEVDCRLWAMPFDFRNSDEEDHYLKNDLQDLEKWHMQPDKFRLAVSFYERYGFRIQSKDKELMVRSCV